MNQTDLMSQSSRDLMKSIREDQAKREALAAQARAVEAVPEASNMPLYIGLLLILGVIVGLAVI